MADAIQLTGVNAKGFGRIPKLVMLDKRLSIEAKAIYAYLASYSGGGKAVYPSRDKIMSDLGISKNRYYNHFNLLLDFKFINVIKQQNFNSNNTYTFNEYVSIETEEQENESLQNTEDQIVQETPVLSKGYGTIPKLVMQDANLPIESKAIYALFCSFAGSGNTASPKTEDIFYFLGITPKRYYKFVKDLEINHYLEIKMVQEIINNKPISHNIYILLDKKTAEEDVRLQNEYSQNEDFQSGDNRNGDFQNGDFQNGDIRNGDFQNEDFQNGDFQNEDITFHKIPNAVKNEQNNFTNSQNNIYFEQCQNEDFQNKDFQNKDFGNKDIQNEDIQSEDFRNKDFQNGDFRNNDKPIDNNNNPNINKNNINNQSITPVNSISDEEIVMEMIENGNQIPYSTGEDKSKMKQTIEILVDFKNLVSDMAFADKCLSMNILRILVELATTKEPRLISGRTILYTDAIDRINENIQLSELGIPSMPNFFPSFIKEYKETISKHKITDPNKYLTSCIYNWLCVCNLPSGQEENNKKYDFETLAKVALL